MTWTFEGCPSSASFAWQGASEQQFRQQRKLLNDMESKFEVKIKMEKKRLYLYLSSGGGQIAKLLSYGRSKISPNTIRGGKPD